MSERVGDVDDDSTRTAADEEVLVPLLDSLPRGMACTFPLLLLLPLNRTREDCSVVAVVVAVVVATGSFGWPSKARNELQIASADGDGGKISAIVSVKRIQRSKQWVYMLYESPAPV